MYMLKQQNKIYPTFHADIGMLDLIKFEPDDYHGESRSILLRSSTNSKLCPFFV